MAKPWKRLRRAALEQTLSTRTYFGGEVAGDESKEGLEMEVAGKETGLLKPKCFRTYSNDSVRWSVYVRSHSSLHVICSLVAVEIISSSPTPHVGSRVHERSVVKCS